MYYYTFKLDNYVIRHKIGDTSIIILDWHTTPTHTIMIRLIWYYIWFYNYIATMWEKVVKYSNLFQMLDFKMKYINEVLVSLRSEI